MKPTAPNPYWNVSLNDLRAACARLAGELEQPASRTAEERRALAADVRHLLIAAAARFTTGDTIPGAPENSMRMSNDPSLARVFGDWHRQQCAIATRECRTVTVQRAAEFVLGRGAEEWLHPTGRLVDGDRGERAVASDEELADVLAELEQVHRRRRRPPA